VRRQVDDALVAKRPMSLRLDIDEIRTWLGPFSAAELRGLIEHASGALPAVVADLSFARVIDVTGLSPSKATEAVEAALKDF
jgi:hypothetical protein